MRVLILDTMLSSCKGCAVCCQSVTNLAWLQKVNAGVLQIPLHLQLINETPPAARKPEHLTRSATEVALWVHLPWQGQPVKEWAYGRSRVKVIQRRSAAARTLSNNFHRGRSVSGYSRISDNSRGPTKKHAGGLPQVCQSCMERSDACTTVPVLLAERSQEGDIC